MDAGHVYHLFVVRAKARGDLQTRLAADNIETLVHYPIPIPRQPAFAGTSPAGCPNADRACEEILSLPLHPGLRDDDVDAVAAAIKRGRTPFSETSGTKKGYGSI
jgi:dTDP-4-amino-4,6-dideoxygalactose transaminase